jgi:hypothetical protein
MLERPRCACRSGSMGGRVEGVVVHEVTS